jgi:hypothetical protein
MKARNLLIIALLLISLISLIAISPLSNAQQTANLSIDPNITQLTSTQVGTTVKVNLTVSNVQNLFAWSLNLTWNPQLLNLTQIQEGPFLTNLGQTIFTWNPTSSPNSRSQGYLQDVVAEVLLTSATANGTGVLATLSFKVLNTGESQISIDGTTLSNPSDSNGVVHQIASTITDGIVRVETSNNNPTPASTSTPTPTLNPTTTTSSTPTSLSYTSVTPNPTVPEFPAAIIIAMILIASSVSLIILKKNMQNI